LFWCWHGTTPMLAARRGYLFGLGMFGVGVSWIYVAISDFGFTAAPVAALVTFIFVAFLALFPALQAYLTISLSQRTSNRIAWLSFPVMWILFEWIRGWILTGFPWLNLGYSQIDSPLIGYAPILGSYGLSLLVVFTSALIWQSLTTKSREFRLSLLVVLVVWLAGFFIKSIEWTQPVNKPVSVALVQGNLPQLTKWDPKRILHRLEHYASLSGPYWGRKDAIIWPENALTIFWQDAPEEYRQRLKKLATESKTDLVIGLPYGTDAKYYSSLLVLGHSPGIYHKRHLVPFGEYVPLASVLRGLIGFFDLPMSGFSPGDKDQKPLTVAGEILAPSLCYEDAFGEELIDFLPEATLLVNGSNNAWYGNSLAPHQHLQIARMRAVETGRQAIRATTTGISALIDHHGRFIATSPQFEQDVLEGEVQPRSGATPYVRWGNIPVLFIIFSLLGFLLWRARSSQ
jgi:apolipoprotein N-acyltransferase